MTKQSTVPIRQMSLTRRRVLGLLAATFPGILAACRLDDDDAALPEPSPEPSPEADVSPPAPTPTPQPSPNPTPIPPTPTPIPVALSLAIDPRISSFWNPVIEELREAFSRFANARGRALHWGVEAPDAAIVITHETSHDDTLLADRRVALLPVASPRLPALNLTTEEIRAVFTGEVTDWQFVGANWSFPIVRIALGDIAADNYQADIVVETYDDLVREFHRHAGGIGLLPAPIIDYRVQSLVIDDRDLLRDLEGRREWEPQMRLAIVARESEHVDLNELSEILGSFNNPDPEFRPFVVTFAGDIILGRTVHTIMTQRGDFTAPFQLVSDELRKGDLTIGNLECALSDTITPPADPLTFSFMTRTAAVEGLALGGLHAVSQANNHSMDFGAAGMRDTLAALDGAGIRHFGIGENLDAAREPCILEHDGVTVAVLGYDGITGSFRGATPSSPGTMPLNADLVREDITRVRDHVDLVIPYFHWGIEYTLTPTPGDRALAHLAIDAGADVVMGSHPHWVQGLEYYQGRPIFYSLSNFIFDQEWSLETKQGFIVHLTFERARLIGMRLVPVLIEDFYRPRVVEDEMREIILDRVWRSTDLVSPELASS